MKATPTPIKNTAIFPFEINKKIIIIKKDPTPESILTTKALKKDIFIPIELAIK
jgi:hypothetical protein